MAIVAGVRFLEKGQIVMWAPPAEAPTEAEPRPLNDFSVLW